jgi:hypothetical protein
MMATKLLDNMSLDSSQQEIFATKLREMKVSYVQFEVFCKIVAIIAMKHICWLLRITSVVSYQTLRN